MLLVALITVSRTDLETAANIIDNPPPRLLNHELPTTIASPFNAWMDL